MHTSFGREGCLTRRLHYRERGDIYRSSKIQDNIFLREEARDLKWKFVRKQILRLRQGESIYLKRRSSVFGERDKEEP
jgi:hypothetical protein